MPGYGEDHLHIRDIGGVLLTNGWDHHERKRAAKHFDLDYADMDARHRLNFEIHEEGRLSFREYLDRVVFYTKRPFTRAQFRSFMCEQSKPFPKMHVRKPDIEFFKLALDLASTPAREVLYIENTPIFAQIAEGLGIRSILYKDYNSTADELAAHRGEHTLDMETK